MALKPANLFKFNVGNIVFNENNHWKGQCEPHGRFCTFESYLLGTRALCLLARNYLSRGYNTPTRFVSRYAPSCENDTPAYTKYICKQLCIDPDDKITLEKIPALIRSIVRIEKGPTVYQEWLNDIMTHNAEYQKLYTILLKPFC